MSALRMALAMMAYVEAAPGQWVKPVGYVMLAFDESRSEWSSWFASADTSKRTCFSRQPFAFGEDDTATDVARKLKHHECYDGRLETVAGGGDFEEALRMHAVGALT